MTLDGASIGLIGALAALPQRLAAREVARQDGRLHRGITRRTGTVVLGRGLLGRATAAEIEATIAACAGRTLLGENGFLRRLGLLPAPGPATLARRELLDRSDLAPDDLDRLALFDAFEHDAEPFSFRDLILARKYAGLVAAGATWHAIARSIHRCGPVASLTALSLDLDGPAIVARSGEQLHELDGQLRLGLDADDHAATDDPFAEAEAAEAAGDHDAAAALYARCLAADPADSVAAFNRANCLRTAGRPEEAAADYTRALALDPTFVEARFNLAGLMADRGHPAAARRHLEQAIATDPDYADAVFNLAALAFDAGDHAAARRWWQRYLELDGESDWARRAARGLAYLSREASHG